LPKITVALDGKSIAVGGALQSGAVDVESTVTHEASASIVFLRLNPGVTAEQGFAFLQTKASQDPNTIARVGTLALAVSPNRGTSDVQTTLEPGDYVALDAAGSKPAKFPRTSFTVAAAPQPAALPAPKATVRAIEFAFKGPTTLRVGELVRFENAGFVVHMIAGIRAADAAGARQITRLLRAGKGNQVNRLARGFAGFEDPVSPGVLVQEKVTAAPGIYVLACFMDTQDGREHTQLGMVRTIRVVK
jgi:hypothetical protein